jgi:pimeloyl-ACP methyl ester carboxylesterase
LRGHGRSIRVDLSTTSMYDYAADGCMLALQCKRSPIVLGWSMGGLVALMMAGCRSRHGLYCAGAEHTSASM